MRLTSDSLVGEYASSSASDAAERTEGVLAMSLRDFDDGARADDDDDDTTEEEEWLVGGYVVVEFDGGYPDE